MTATITEKSRIAVPLTPAQKAAQAKYRATIRTLVASGAIRIEDARR